MHVDCTHKIKLADDTVYECGEHTSTLIDEHATQGVHPRIKDAVDRLLIAGVAPQKVLKTLVLDLDTSLHPILPTVKQISNRNAYVRRDEGRLDSVNALKDRLHCCTVI
jgi:hypothetical protein